MLDKAIALPAQLVKVLSAWSGALGALLTPGLAQGTTAHLLLVKPLQAPGADSQPVVKVAGLLSQVQALPARVIQGQTFRAGAGEASFSVDAAATLA